MTGRIVILKVAAFAGMLVLPASAVLMQRVGDAPVIAIDPAVQWRSIHVANAALMTPDESPDGRWRLYIRGSGRFPEESSNPKRNYHDSIGFFTQEADRFSPQGPWKEHPGNPVLVHGKEAGYDGKHLLDCTPVWCPSRAALYMFYKGMSYHAGGCLAVAVSTDGGVSFFKSPANPLQRRTGPCDTVFHDNRFYVFYGETKYNFKTRRPTEKLKIYLVVVDDPSEFSSAPRRLVLDTGAPGSFDSESVHGGRIFKLNNRWYMVYQCSAKHMDYPDRFHVAWSDNLLLWNKVENPEPFFIRGPAGSWDEGAIWYGEVFEHKDKLYMYYEGWGSGRPGYNRNKPYVRGGRSQTGLAETSVEAFLKWCGLGDSE